MPRAYAEDVRRRVVADTDQGLSLRAVADTYSVSPSFVWKLTRQWRRERSVASRQIGGYTRHALAEHADAIRHQLAEQNGMTLVELRDWVRTALDVCVHLSSGDRFVRALGYRYKKTRRASEQDRVDVAMARAAWQDWHPTCDSARVVFLDETSAATDMTRLHGRSLVGARCHAHVPGGHWKTTTVVGALRPDGMTAPFVLDGPMDGDAFLVYVRESLMPTLANGAIVVMDNLPSHTVDGVRELVEATGARLHDLPPYSPDCNPIEQAFSKLTALRRKTAARSIEALWNAIGRIVTAFSAEACKNSFAHSGYVVN